jgi:hypothetical protein
MPAEVLERLAALKPEHSIRIDGIEYVRVYQIIP